MPEYRWNRVGITTPDDWEPAVLERDGLLLEQAGRPVCELKWNVVQGAFSFAKHIKKLSKGNKGVNMEAVETNVMPPSWRMTVDSLSRSGMKLQSFKWSHREQNGIGAAIHNPDTGLAALIQFFVYKPDSADHAASVLASLSDHAKGKTIPWAMFGLSARVPSEFKLHTFSFKPGHYSVKFWRAKSSKQADRVPTGKGPGISLIFERFAPANVLLASDSLRQWAANHMEPTISEALIDTTSQNGFSWQGLSKTSLLRRIVNRQEHDQGRIWLPEDSNAILSVRAVGTLPVGQSTFKRICDSYDIV